METPNSNAALVLLRQSPAFDRFNDKELETLSQLFTPVMFKDGDSIPIRRGHNEPHIYLISSGTFDLNLLIPEQPKQVLITLKQTDLASGFFSHASQHNQISLTATASSTAFQAEWDDLNDFLDNHPVGLNHFNESIQSIFYRAQLSIFFSTRFNIHDPTIYDLLADEIQWKRLQNGEALFKQGDPGNALYMVLSGRLKSVISTTNGETTVSNIINAGEVSGEVAMLTRSERMATVFAIRDSVVAEFSRTAFNKIVEKHPQSMLQLAKLLGNRLKFQSHKQKVSISKTYALIPANPDTCLNDFALKLHEQMQDWDSTLCLNSEDIDKALGITGIAVENSNNSHSSLITQWLERQECQYDHIILVADCSWTNWNNKILRHSDHLLIVADTTDDCKPTEHEKKLLNTGRITKHQQKSLIR